MKQTEINASILMKIQEQHKARSVALQFMEILI